MDLEQLVQRLALDSRQFDSALDRVDRDLRTTGRVSDATTRSIASGFRTAGASVAASSNRIVASSRSMRGALQGVSFQVADIAQQLQAGVGAMQVFSVQGAQIAGAFGPAGAAIGAVVGVLGALASGLFRTGSTAEDAADAIEVLTDSLKALGEQDQAVAQVRDALVELSDEARRFARLEVQLELPDLERQLAEARELLTAEVERGAELLQQQAALQERFGGDPSVVRAQADEAARLVEEFSAGRISAIDFVEALQRFPDPGPFSQLSDDALQAAKQVRTLTEAVEAHQALLQATERTARVLSTEPFGPPEPPEPTGGARPPRGATGPRIAPAPMSRSQAQDFGLAVASIEQGGAADFAGQLDQLRQMGQQAAIAQRELAGTTAEANAALAAQGVTVDQVAIAYDLAHETSQLFASTAAAGIADAVTGASSLGDAMEGVARSFGKAVLEALVFQSIMAAIGGPAGGGQAATGLFSLFGSSAPAERQHGGPARRGQPYIVGEAGTELFVPDTSGMIVPRSTGGGGGAGGWPAQATVSGPLVMINDQRGPQAPPIETNVDVRGVVTATIRAEVGAMGRDGTLGQLTGVRRRGIARG